MKQFYSFKIDIEPQPLQFQFSWNDTSRLTRVSWNEESNDGVESNPPYAVAAIAREIKNYFRQGEPLLPLHWDLIDSSSLSDFAKKVYETILLIPHGETRTYAWVAEKMGKPLAARAVGQALRRNPFPILIPCHRVVADKSLGGFMGSDDPEQVELQFKGWLISHEREYINPSFPFMLKSS